MQRWTLLCTRPCERWIILRGLHLGPQSLRPLHCRLRRSSAACSTLWWLCQPYASWTASPRKSRWTQSCGGGEECPSSWARQLCQRPAASPVNNVDMLQVMLCSVTVAKRSILPACPPCLCLQTFDMLHVIHRDCEFSTIYLSTGKLHLRRNN